MLILCIRFVTGRFHSQPWDENVNGGGLEWPPSPWHILRAIVAAGLSAREPRWDHLNTVVRQAAQQPPIYRTPPVTVAQWPAEQAHRSTSPMVLVGGDRPLYVEWPDAVLSAMEVGWLTTVLRRVRNLGPRGNECAVTLLDQEPQWDSGTTTLLPHALGSTDVVRLLTPTADATVGDLTMTKDEVRGSHHRSRPPATRFVSYPRVESLATMVTLPLPAQPRGSLTEVVAAHYILQSASLPRLLDTAPVAEGFRAAAESQYGRLHDMATSPILSGHEGASIRPGHGHAHYLPTAESGDLGRLDHVLVWAPDGFTTADLAALARIERVYFPTYTRLAPLTVALQGLRSREEFAAMYPSTDSWISVTPFLPSRHPHRRRNPDGSVRWSDTARDEVILELNRRGWPVPSDVVVERTSTASFFRAPRAHAGSRGAPSAAYTVTLRFSEPVRGPCVLGRWAHIGLGQFRPLEVR